MTKNPFDRFPAMAKAWDLACAVEADTYGGKACAKSVKEVGGELQARVELLVDGKRSGDVTLTALVPNPKPKPRSKSKSKSKK